MIAKRTIRLVACLLAVGMLQGLAGWAETKSFVTQVIKRDKRPQLQGGWLDLDDMKKTLPARVEQQHIPPPPPPEYGIVGLDLKIYQSDYPMVQAVFKGAPAHQKGILPGDNIVSINGVSTLGRSRSQVDALISDVPGEQVELLISRGPELKRITLTVMGVDEATARALMGP